MTSHAVVFDYDTGPPVERGRLGIWLFLGSEVMFFGGLLSAWLVLRSATPVWPGREHLALGVGGALTAVLVLSSWTAGRAVRAAARDDSGGVTLWLLVTVLLGAGFLGGQFYEFRALVDAGLLPRSGVRWASFYALTGCHGLHVLAGVLWFVGLLPGALRGRLSRWRRQPLEYCVLYWHFVDLVWIVLFALLYLVG